MHEDDYQLRDEDFFTAEEVTLIKSLAHETICMVDYVFWVNKAKGQQFEVLDFICLHLESKKTLWLGTHDESGGLLALSAFDWEAKAKALNAEFKGLVVLEKREASNHKIWKDCLNKAITPSLLRHDSKTLNESIALKFEGSHAIEIFPGLDGLEVDYFEE